MTAFSFLIAALIRLSCCGLYWGTLNPTSFQVVGVVTIVVYCVSAWNNLTNSKNDATKVEHLMLENAIKIECQTNDLKLFIKKAEG